MLESASWGGGVCSWGVVPAQGGVHARGDVPAWRGVYLPRGCTCRGVGAVPVQGVNLPGGVPAQGCTYRGWVGGCTCQGVYLLGGVYLPRGSGVCTCPGGLLQGGVCSGGCTEVHPPVNRITHTCKNITLGQLRCGR